MRNSHQTGENTAPIPVTEGLMQGEVLSPLLFSLYLFDIEANLREKGLTGVRILKDLELHLLMFADDTVIISSTPRGLQLKIWALKRYFANLKLKVNLGKTRVVVFRRGGRLPKNLKFYFGEDEIEIVKQCVYLGVPFSSSCKFRIATTHFKAKAKRAAAAVLKTIFRGRIVNLEFGN